MPLREGAAASQPRAQGRILSALHITSMSDKPRKPIKLPSAAKLHVYAWLAALEDELEARAVAELDEAEKR